MSKKANVAKLEHLFSDYDKARAEAKEAAKTQAELSTEIKEILGDTEEVDTPRFVTTYKCDKDKEVESFDEEAFETKDPKGYARWQTMVEETEKLRKKFVKKTVVKGARKLIIVRKED